MIGCNETTPPIKLIMREEVSDSGAPLPLIDLLANVSDISTEDPEVKSLWANAIVGLKRVIAHTMPEVEIVMPKLWEGDLVKKDKLKGLGLIAVTLDSYDTTNALPLKVSRHFSLGGKTQIGIGNRPGSPPLDEQIYMLKAKIGANPIALLEDDIYTGGTAKYVIERLQAAGLKVQMFIPGVQVSEIDIICGVGVEPVERYTQGTVLDIVDPRDLLFGTKDAGLAIKESSMLLRVPYVLPYVDITSRAGVSVLSAVEFSKGIIGVNALLFSELEVLLGKKILIGHTARPFQDFVASNTPMNGTSSMLDFCQYTLEQLK